MLEYLKVKSKRMVGLGLCLSLEGIVVFKFSMEQEDKGGLPV